MIDAATVNAIAEAVAAKLASQPARPAASFLGVDEAAKHVGVSSKTIRRLLDTGKLTRYRPTAGKIVVSLLELENYVRSTSPKPKSKARTG